jgi:hypothetical protein
MCEAEGEGFLHLRNFLRNRKLMFLNAQLVLQCYYTVSLVQFS